MILQTLKTTDILLQAADFVGFFILITESETALYLNVLLFMKRRYFFSRSVPRLARSFSESSFDDEDGHTAWVK
jgi:hypothetical protein